MGNKKIFLVLLYFLFVIGEMLFAQDSPALTRFLKRGNLTHAAISLKAVDLSNGQVFVSHNENMALIPASNLKIVTTATALDVLGPNFRYETHLFYSGSIQDSVLTGNVYVKGAGDPTLGSEFMNSDKEAFLKEWLAAIQKAGIKRISGDIVVLDQLFGYEGVSSKWLLEDIGNYYASGIYGISVFDNMYRLYIQTNAPGTGTRILRTEPTLKELAFTDELSISETPSDDIYIFGTPFSNQRRLTGTAPANKSSIVVKGDIPDPGLFLAQYFYTFLQNRDVKITGKATTYRLEPQEAESGKDLLPYKSHSLEEIVREVNVKSNNHYAEHLYKTITVSKQIDIPAYWKSKGLDSNALNMFDGSGLSPVDAVSSGFLVDILVYMDKKDGTAGAFYKSLPVAGREGTVASFLKNTPLEGKARLKSGSITSVHSYSGYIENNNKRYAVSLIVNNFSGKRPELRKAIEQLFVALFTEQR
jgi:D-alanyl-D-alanine carboxypeptidase/D-alanyl-D-alanine-endopeptidase (penicillin-binding protein 4)